MGEVIYGADFGRAKADAVAKVEEAQALYTAQDRFLRHREMIGLTAPTTIRFAPDTAPAEYVAPPDDCA